MPSSKTANKAKTRQAAKRPANRAPTAGRSASRGSESKQAAVITLLKQPKGVTVPAIMKATGWQQHSVRGFLAGVVRKRLKLDLQSAVVEGVRIYRITDGHDTTPARTKPGAPKP